MNGSSAISPLADLAEVLSTVAPVFLVIGVGFVLRLAKFIPAELVAQLSRLVFYVSAPCLVFRSAALTRLSEALNWRVIAAIYAVSIISVAAGYLIAARSKPSRRGVLAQGIYRANIVFVGIPVVLNALGPEALGGTSITIGFTIPMYNLLAVIALSLPHRGGDGGVPGLDTGPKSGLLKSIVMNPLIIGAGGGVLFSALKLPLPGPADQALEMIGKTASPLALLVVGASLDLARVKREMPATLLVSLGKLAVYPFLVFLALRWLGVTGQELIYPVLLTACPIAVVSHVMSREMGGDEQLSGALIVGTTLFSLPTITAWLFFFKAFSV